MKKLLLLLFLIPFFACAQDETTGGYARWDGTGTDDNDVLFIAVTESYSACMLMSTTGAVDVEGTLDGSAFSDPISLQDLGATTTDPVLVTAADRMYAFVGKFDQVRVRQNGATGAAASMLCWNLGGGQRF